MKKRNFARIFSTFATLIILANSAFAEAREKSKTTRTQTDVTTTSYSATESEPHYSSSNMRYGLGFSAMSKLMSDDTSIAGLIEVSPRLTIQPMFSLAKTSPTVQVTFGGLGKYTVVKNGLSGFHLGGGLSLGAIDVGGSSEFAFALTALGGFHFPIPGTQNIMVHLDGGPVFSHVGGTVSTNNFSIDSLSPAFGLTIAYMF